MKATQKGLLRWAVIGLAGLLGAKLISRQQRAMSLQNKVALVTGGSRGLGLELARVLVEEGAKMAICARNAADLKKAKHILNALAKKSGNPHEVLIFTCDVGKLKQVEAMIQKITRKLGPVEVLINNAGTIQVGPVEEVQLSDHAEALNAHYWGPLYTMQTVLPDMRKRQAGRIVNIASIGGKVSIPHLVPYSASKHALVGLSRGYHAELLKDHIYVTTVCPGLMRTGSPRNAIFKGKHRKEYAWFTIGDSSPLSSVNAYDAARQIIRACRYGKSDVTISVQAVLLAGLNNLLPGLMADVLGLVNRALPSAGGIGKQQKKGYQSKSWLAPSFLTIRSQQAARRNNQL